MVLAICEEIRNPTDYLQSIRSIEVDGVVRAFEDIHTIPRQLHAFGRDIRDPVKLAVIREIALDRNGQRIPDSAFWEVVRDGGVHPAILAWGVSRDSTAPSWATELLSRITSRSETQRVCLSFGIAAKL
jgi:hypothetical protein